MSTAAQRRAADMEPDIVMSSVAVAEAIGPPWTRKRAWAAMREIERLHPGVVWREKGAGGDRLVGWGRQLAKHIPALRRMSDGEARILEQLRLVQEDLADLSRRLDAEVRNRLALQRELRDAIARVRRPQ